jgi:methyl-accepting chemotaxis protein
MSSKPNQGRLKSLRAKILIFAGVPVVLMLVLVIGFLTRSALQEAYRSSLFKIGIETFSTAARIETWNMEIVTVPKVMATAQENGLFGHRKESIEYAKHILEMYPQFTGSYFGYETNADGQDAEFMAKASAEDKRACNETGRFIPYWFRDKQDTNKIILNPLIDMETSFYYQGVKNRAMGVSDTEGIKIPNGISTFYNPTWFSTDPVKAKAMVTEPYVYEGKLMIEQTYPITINGKFVGIAGCDRALTQIDEFVTGLKPFKTSDFILISRRGRIISATMDADLKTHRVEETPFSDVLLKFYKAQTNAPLELVKDPASGESYFYGSAKIPTGDWTLVMRVSKREILAPVWSEFTGALVISATGLLITIAILIWLAGSVATPIATAANVANRVAEGDLTAKVEGSTTGETGLLLSAIRIMIQNLNGLVGQVKSSSIQVISTATQISAAAKSQESTVSEFGSSTNQIAAAVNEISATSQQLVKTMDDVSTMVSGTAELADSGRTSLGGMETTMRHLSDATGSISSKLAVISEKAKNITGVVTTITKVADQTNLLSLNAAIEAEKAGEYGLGFSVVAREIRRLADQTAVATLDIDQMVKEMQSAVSAGVMEMDKFTEQVHRGVDAAERLSGQLGQIIEQVQQLTPRFESVNQGMKTQSDGAGQISSAMINLTQVARTTTSSISEFNKAATGLHEAVRMLREEVARFKVAE